MSRYDITDVCMKMLEILERDSTAKPMCMKMLEILERDLATRPVLTSPQGCSKDVIIDPATLAVVAIGATLQYLAALGRDADKSAAGAAGKTEWEWVKGKLTSDAGKEAVTDFENFPEDGDNRRATEAALSKFLRLDRIACFELAKLLENGGSSSTVLITNIVGDKNIVGQAPGSGTVSINKGSTHRSKPSKASRRD